MRLQSPSIAFSASAFLRPGKGSSTDAQSDPYLLSGEPSPENLFAPLSKVKLRSGQPPSLSSYRLNRVRPLLGDEGGDNADLHVHVPQPTRVLSAISSKLRHVQSQTRHANLEAVVVLDLEISPFTQKTIELSSVTVSLDGGSAEDLGKGVTPKLPIQCRPQDNIIYLYRLRLDPLVNNGDQNLSKLLDVSIRAHVISSNKCRPSIEMHWTTLIEFSAALNPSYGVPQQSLQRYNRPGDLELPAADLRHGTGSNPTYTDSTNEQAIDTNVADATRLRVNFNAPSKAYVHEEFALQVLISNSVGQSRKLILSTIPRDELSQNDGPNRRAPLAAVTSKENPFVPNVTHSEGGLSMQLRNAKANDNPGILPLSGVVEIG